MTRHDNYNRIGVDYMNETLTLIVFLLIFATIQERGDPRCPDRMRDTAVTHLSVSNRVCVVLFISERSNICLRRFVAEFATSQKGKYQITRQQPTRQRGLRALWADKRFADFIQPSTSQRDDHWRKRVLMGNQLEKIKGHVQTIGKSCVAHMALRCMKHFPPFPLTRNKKRKEQKRKQKGNGGHDVAEGRRVRERRNGDEQCGHEWVLPVTV